MASCAQFALEVAMVWADHNRFRADNPAGGAGRPVSGAPGEYGGAGRPVSGTPGAPKIAGAQEERGW